MRKIEEYKIDLNTEEKKSVKKAKQKIDIFEVFQPIISALVVVTLVFLFCFRVFNVDGPSMAPTLENGDRVVVSTIGYKPKRGDIVELSSTDGIR